MLAVFEVIYLVDFSAAAGKSTFLRLLEELNPAYRVVAEPLTKWLKVPAEGEVGCACVCARARRGDLRLYSLQEMTDSQKHGDNLLDLFYKDPHRWAYSFQVL